MSKQLAISVSFSVLLMSAYVLFGTAAAPQPLSPASFSAPATATATASGLPNSPERLLPIIH